MQFQGHQPCSGLWPPVLERAADSLNIPPELQQLGHRAILTLEVGSLQATFRPACQQPSLVWCCKGRLVKISMTIDAVLVNSRALRPPPRFKHHHIIGRNVVRLALCTWGRCENDCKVFKVACVPSVPRFGSVWFEFIEPWTRTRTRTCPPCCFLNPNQTWTYNIWTQTEPEPMILELELNPNL